MPQQGGDFFSHLLLFFVQRFDSWDGFGAGLSTSYTLCFYSQEDPKIYQVMYTSSTGEGARLVDEFVGATGVGYA